MKILKETKVYVDQPFVKIIWTEEGNAVHIEWKENPSQENYQYVLQMQREIIRKHGCMKVCLNSKGLRNTVANS